MLRQGMAMDIRLSETLAMVALAMRAARSPWWVIGSAAVALHGADQISVADVDILLSVEDANAILLPLGLTIGRGGEHDMFRSEIFARWETPPLTVEFMAGFAVLQDASWQSVWPQTQQLIPLDGAKIPVPERSELIAILTQFGRPKDNERADILRGLA